MRFLRLFLSGVAYWLAEGLERLGEALDDRPPVIEPDAASDTIFIPLSANGHSEVSISRRKEQP